VPALADLCPLESPTPAANTHRHGTAPATAMTHIAIQEELDGKVVEWMEHVSGEQYRKSSVTAGPRIPHPENLR